jgi:ABC-type cobalamin/Fe3+-siderophores transport system ATPase subunit
MIGLQVDTVTWLRGQRRVLDGIDLTLGTRGAVALVGPNGAGKSSLLRVMAGLLRPNAGQVCWDGEDLTAMPPRRRARLIGYIPQHFHPYWDPPVDELLRIALERAGRHDVPSTLARFGLSGLRARRWSSLSGGERARALIAAVLGVDPPLVLADEPGASLDVRHRIDLVRNLVALGQERLVVVVMHDVELALRYFQRIAVIHEGRWIGWTNAADDAALPLLGRVFGVSWQRVETPRGARWCPELQT